MIKLKDLLTEVVDARFEKAANAFLKGAQKIVTANEKKQNLDIGNTELSFDKGRRYWRIWSIRQGDARHKSAWAFIDTTNGDVLKPASWRAPAKHARGNIYDSHGGTSRLGPYGPAYL